MFIFNRMEMNMVNISVRRLFVVVMFSSSIENCVFIFVREIILMIILVVVYIIMIWIVM